MDIKQIKSLAEIMKNYNLASVEVCEGDKKIKIEKGGCGQGEVQYAPAMPAAPVVKQSAATAVTDSPVDFNNITEVKSPMVGVFYASPSPDSAPYVKVGDKVKKGDVLCIIEAMKLMNEICAESEGEVVDICAQNEQIVEYNQTLFKIY